MYLYFLYRNVFRMYKNVFSKYMCHDTVMHSSANSHILWLCLKERLFKFKRQ